MKCICSPNQTLIFKPHTSTMLLKPAVKDLFIVIFGVLMSYAFSLLFNFSETFNSALAKYEHLQLDEIPLALFVMSILSAWYSHRRLIELRLETDRRKEVEVALAKSQQLFKALFDNNLSGNFVLDSDGNIEMFNDAFSTICGIKDAKSNLSDLLKVPWSEINSQLSVKREVNFQKLKLIRADGLPSFVIARFIYNDSSVDRSSPNKIYGYFSDITEVCLAEIDLEKVLLENQHLSRHAMMALEEERKYIAREIHDDTGQYLSAIRMDALAISTGKANVSEISQRIAANAVHIQNTIKALLKYLRPQALDSRGLSGAVEHLVLEWQQLNPDMTYEVTNSIESEHFSEEINIVAFRVIQESLTNIAKHAHAKRVKVKLCVQTFNNQSYLTIEVRDDGRGLMTKDNHAGIGLIGMRERIESVHGEFKLLSGEQAGTLISAIIPIANPSPQPI